MDIWKAEKAHEKGECICGKLFLDRKSYYSKDLMKDSNVTRNECKIAGFKSLAVIPLTYYNEFFGAMLFASFEERDIRYNEQLIDDDYCYYDFIEHFDNEYQTFN